MEIKLSTSVRIFPEMYWLLKTRQKNEDESAKTVPAYFQVISPQNLKFIFVPSNFTFFKFHFFTPGGRPMSFDSLHDT